MNAVALLIIITFCPLLNTKTFNYCKLNCKTVKHSACRTLCKKSKHIIKELGPSYEFRYRMLKKHNIHRNKTASGTVYPINTDNGTLQASNMMILNYDMTLEFTAACWLYQTADAVRDKCGGTTTFPEVAQNFYKGYQADPRTVHGIDKIFEEWIQSGNKLTKKLIGFYEDTDDLQLEQYIQIIWAKTYAIGCAKAIVDNKDKRTWFVVVCTYGPSPLRVREIFRIGDTASSCPYMTKQNPTYTALCGNLSQWPPGAYGYGNPELKLQRQQVSFTGFKLSPSIKLLLINLSLRLLL